MEKAVILGAGSWGSALGILLGRKGHRVSIWDYKKDRADAIEAARENTRYLPQVKFPETVHVTGEAEGLLKGIQYVIFSVPSQKLREVVRKFSGQISDRTILVNTAKGIEILSGMRLSEVMKDEILGKYHRNIVVLSGPTHAEEVAVGLPSAIVAAGDPAKAKKVQRLLNSDRFRIYINDDIIGVELGAAVKNCLAIGAGITDGLGFGDNTKAALITRGIAEMIRYGKALGAKETTFSGLSGIGDLVVTCTSRHSRNRHVGELLGKGEKIEQILSRMIMVAEGVPTVKAIYESAKKLGVSMPLVNGIYDVIYNNVDPRNVVEGLMRRSTKEEFYEKKG
ncbi:MAG: NAD(P)H-dependent glycerol-3-phosphate dehydrogenase [Fusobacteriaceae bacterium]|nr:NAD(P)H-dependent glycerol-3-phosphate dehydrogenase [Fusobacteriaceae bacterium]